MLINFWDRTALGLAALPIMKDLHLSHAQFGLLGSSFFALFALSAYFVGWLTDRLATKWLIASMALVWAVAQAVMAGAAGLPQALASRILLGAGEGAALPTSLYAAFSWFPNDRRSLVSAAVTVGVPLGVASGALVITWAIAALGWHAAFASLSAASLLWCVAWSTLHPQRTTDWRDRGGGSRQGARPWFEWNTPLLGAILAAFAVQWVGALASTWFPAALQIALGLTSSAAGVAIGSAWALQIPALLLAGWISSLRRRKQSAELALAIPAILSIALSGVAMIGMGASAATGASLALMILCVVSLAVAIACLPPLVGDVTPRGRLGIALGSYIAVSSLGGLVGPSVFGALVDASGVGPHAYRVALVASGIIITLTAPVAFMLTRMKRVACYVE
jgi:MFS family permease